MEIFSMIVTCPACRNKYSVQAEAIGDGKLVRCVICGATWQQLAVSGVNDDKSRVIETIKWTFFWSIVFISLFMLFFAKSTVTRVWTPAASFYTFLENKQAGEKKMFKMNNVSNFFVKKCGKLYMGLKGELVNTSDEVQILPSITISLKNEEGAAPGKFRFKKIWTHDMLYKKILPNQKVAFETELQSIPHNNLICDIKLDVL